MSWQAPTTVRRVLTWVYWPALVLGLIVAIGWAMGAVTGPRHTFSALGAMASLAFSGLVAWRLWLNKRSLGEGGPLPSGQTFFRVFLPLGLLALIGLSVVAVGIVMIVGWALLTFDAPNAGGYQAPEMSYFGAIGAVALLIGAGMCWPLVQRLGRSRVLDSDSKLEDQND